MKVRDFKNKVYDELAAITKALGNPHRLEIIDLLAQRPCSVEYIAENTGMSIANASQHLQSLRNARLVKAEKKGKYSFYSLASMSVFGVWKSMRELAFAQNAEIGKLIQDFRKSRHTLESITTDELLERIQKGEAIALDVRPQDEYEAGHIASAISIPHDELIHNLARLPKNRQIIAYCRGPLCAMADDAVKLLNEQGYVAKRLEIGYPEWNFNGLPVE